ncbi:MAG: invasion associated locus B family protein [Bauldia sp.]|nr:invasion associated locus B family protein [Bauldia sp.]
MTIRIHRASGSIRTAAALASGLAAAAAAAPAAAQAIPDRAIGDWTLECTVPAGAQGQQCSLTQRVYASDRSNIGLDVIVFRTADRQSQLLRVFAPLGVLLPYGLGLRIDTVAIGTTEFVRCFYPEGCMAEVIIDDILLGQLRAGTAAEFVIVTTPGEPIGVPVSLQGFAEGFDALP